MSIMEHWGHRLFPKMPFDELIERVERLGQKKAVQVSVQTTHAQCGSNSTSIFIVVACIVTIDIVVDVC